MYYNNVNNFNYAKKKKSFNLRGIVRAVLGIGQDFCNESNIHGLNHVAAYKRHWIERVLWLLFVVAALWGAMEISLGQLQRFNESPTVVTLEKDFRAWNFSVPSVTICDLDRADETKLPAVIRSFWNISQEHTKYKYYRDFVVTVANASIFNLEAFEPYADDATLAVDLFRLAVEVMGPPLIKASWSGGANIKWRPVMTENGACYSINSLALTDIVIEPSINDTAEALITCKNSKLSCYAMFEVTEPTDFYFHSPYEILDGSMTASRIILTLRRQVELSVIETRAGKGVRELSPQRRKCLYTDEPSTPGKKVYSPNSCRISCRSKLAMDLCGCRPFFYMREAGPLCSPSGLFCLSKHTEQLTKFDVGSCSCSQQCVDAVYQVLNVEDKFWGQGPFAAQGTMRFTVKPPMSRYTREIVFHFHDLVVSFGGAAGLFLGASFISLVEILYFLVWTVAGAFGLKMERQKHGADSELETRVVSHESTRIKELNAILQAQSKMDRDYHMLQRFRPSRDY